MRYREKPTLSKQKHGRDTTADIFAQSRLNGVTVMACTPSGSLPSGSSTCCETSHETNQEELFQRFEAFKLALSASPSEQACLAQHFAALTAQFLNLELSLSVPGLQRLSQGGSDGHYGDICRRLAELYGANHARLNLGGTSGSLLATLVAILPELQISRQVVLVDERAHRATYGGLTYGRWQSVGFRRRFRAKHSVPEPIRADDVIAQAEEIGATNIAAIVSVSPDYDGFRNPGEEQKLIRYAKAHGITLIIDAAWGSLAHDLPLAADIVLISPHKRAVTPSSVGAFFTASEEIAALYDSAMEQGFGSTSLSFLQLVATEHMLNTLTPERFGEIHLAICDVRCDVLAGLAIHAPKLRVMLPGDVGAEVGDPAHLLLGLPPGLSGWKLASYLSRNHQVHCEKAEARSVLFLLSPAFTKRDVELLVTALADGLAHLVERVQ